MRLAGQDRFARSARVAQEYDHADVIFLAVGISYADALSAAPAAAIFPDTPLLLTLPNSIRSVISQEIKRLKPTTVFVIGGPGVVSATVLQQVETLTDGAIIQRFWGTNRYLTSKSVYETFVVKLGAADRAR